MIPVKKNKIAFSDISQLMAAQGILFVLQEESQLGEFVCQAIKNISVVNRCCIYIRGIEKIIGDDSEESKKILKLFKKASEDQNHVTIPLTSDNIFWTIPIKTSTWTYGHILITIFAHSDSDKLKSIISNFANMIAVDLERRRQKKEIDEHQQYLEKQVHDRTKNLEEEIQMRIKIEESLKLANEIINKSPTVVFLWKNENGWPVEFVSENVINLTGYTKEDFTKRKISYLEIIHSEDQDRVSNEVSININKKKNPAFEHSPYRIVNKNGDLKWLEDKTSIRRDLKGNITHFEGVVHDITEKILIKGKLKLSEDNYRSLYNNSPDMYVSVSPDDTTIKQCNDRLIKETGYKKEEIIGAPIYKMYHEDCMDDVKIVFQDFVKTGEVQDRELILKRKDGSKINVSLNVNAIRDNTGKIIHSISSWRDITGRKNTEKKLLDNHNHLESIFRAAPIGIGVVKDRKISFVNDRFLEMTGYSKEDLIGQSSRIIYQTQEEFERVGKYKYEEITKKGTGTTETVFQKKDGSLINALLSSTPINQNDLSEGVTFTALDITDRYKAEFKLNHSHKLMRYIIEHNQSAVAVHDKNFKYIYVSQNYLDQYGVKEKNIIGKHHYDVFPNLPQKWRDVHLKALKGEISSADDDPYEKEDGTIEWTRWECRPWYEADDSIGGFIIYTEIITERKKVEEEIKNHRSRLEELVNERTLELEENTKKLEESQKAMLFLLEDVNEAREDLEESNKKLEYTNKELESFAYSVSHDLRAPLRAIDGFTNILMTDYVSNFDDEGKRLGSIVRDNTHKMAQLIDDLLAFSRMGRASMNYSEIDMKSMAQAIFLEATSVELRKRIDFSITDLPNIDADPNMMRQVWMNLISNAVKFSAKQEKAIISITFEDTPDKISYQIKDNGAGFNMEYNEKLFGVFQRLHSEKEFEGNGVGLALVQRIIQRHNGEINANSKINKGATFYFSIPKK